jgi:transposase
MSLRSNALAVRFEEVAPGPDFVTTSRVEQRDPGSVTGKRFQVVPWRWAVERTFAWLLNDRRHSRD